MVEVKDWCVKDIAEALVSKVDEKIINSSGIKKIEVPMFQRNLVWSFDQKKLFIDSLEQGFPIGTLLLYNAPTGTFKLIDGLQRSSTLKDYINNPTFYFDPFVDIDENTIKKLYESFKITLEFKSFEEKVRTDIQNLINSIQFKDVSPLKISQTLIEKYWSENVGIDQFKLLDVIEDILKDNIEKYKEKYEKIANTRVPAIIYTGDEGNLPTVFERINNNGTQLSKYQIYAATWATRQKPITVKNEEIVKKIIEKYDSFIEEGYTLDNYDKDELLDSKNLSMFEYVLGFGKFIASEYDNLFQVDKNAQDINQIGFELLNACFKRDTAGIKDLDKELYELDDINDLENKILATIKTVSEYIRPFIDFKGNKRANANSSTIFHSKYQIISIIAFVFKEKYCRVENHFEEVDKQIWNEKNKKLKSVVPQIYFYDILNRNWAEGNQGNLHSVINSKDYYLKPITKERWNSSLDNWFITSLDKKDYKQVKNPQPIEKLFLNYVYSDKFSSKDEKSQDNFDIEHLCTKKFMKDLMIKNKWEQGLPVSSIGNICYLPEYDNRKKQDNTIYQDKKYLKYLEENDKSLKDIEEKFTLTTKEGMEWLNKKYGSNDYDKFFGLYKQFLTNRYEKMKVIFYKTLGIKD